MTTPQDEDSARLSRWRTWIRVKAAERGYNFPPYGQKSNNKSGALKDFATLVGKGSSTVTRWFEEPPNDDGCRALARGLGIPQAEVFAAAYGTDESAQQLIPSGFVPVVDKSAYELQDLLANPYLSDDYKAGLRGMIEASKQMAKAQEEAKRPNGDGGTEGRAAS